MEINRSKERVKMTGEIFTPRELVLQVLEEMGLFKEETFDQTVIDPACGDGNFLVEVLRVRLEGGQDPSTALENIYGIDIMEDNIEACKENLLKLAGRTEENLSILNRNIKCGDALKIDDFENFFK